MDTYYAPRTGILSALAEARDIGEAGTIIAKRLGKLGYSTLIARRLALPGLQSSASTLVAIGKAPMLDLDRAAIRAESLSRTTPWSTNALDLDELAHRMPDVVAPFRELGLNGVLLVLRFSVRQGRLLFVFGRAKAGSNAAHRVALLDIVDAFVDWMECHAPQGHAARSVLTAREREILSIAADGLTHEVIADQLSISVSGVMSRLRSAQRKLAAGNRSQAIARAIWLGEISVFIEPPEQTA